MQGETMIQGLLRPDVYTHETDAIRLVETHCAWVLLTGQYVYKVKKPVNFGFLDFSTLEKRHFYCTEEVRLNRRFAPDIYLGVVTITGTPAQPQLDGNGELLDYAVRMRQFPDNGLLSQLAASQALEAAHIDQLVRTLGDFHRDASRATAADSFGDPAHTHHWVRENFQHIQPLLTPADKPDTVEPLRQWSEGEYARLTGLLQARKDAGSIRECHGDLHLGNITLIDGRVTPFDCIEFNPELRWIDVFSEVAFLLMDLDDHGQTQFANRFLNGYLQDCGDYAGLEVLRYYRVYRAMVRAKVAILTRQQAEQGSVEHDQASGEYQRYVGLAQTYTMPDQAVMVITRGLSGSGKSTVAREFCERTGVIQLRSDVERKRLAGLSATESSRSDTGTGLYTADRTANTYQHLGALAKTVLAAGYSVIVDATFLKREQRDRFRTLAAATATPFLVLECVAENSELEHRILSRNANRDDASEATLEVLHAQQAGDEPLTKEELKYTLRVDTQHMSSDKIWSSLQDWMKDPGVSSGV
ncbi:MAG TPA: aminoglycoside phosphotransferase [Gammaproteobacteria bacterium]|nr:aminoglycoside phosphotransferase [Gammaproteobacteria bacterium]